MEANSINNEISDYDKLKNYLIHKDISEVKNIIKNRKKSIIKDGNIRDLLYILNDRGLGKNYKLKHNFEYFSLIIDMYLENKDNNIIGNSELNFLLSSVTRIFNGHKILMKIDKHFKFSVVDDYYLKRLSYSSFYRDSIFYGTFPTYLYWSNILKDKVSITPDEELVNSIGNSDDRIFKYILKNKHKNIKLSESHCESLFRNLFTNNIPNKYILRRIKFLSTYFNLTEKFTTMITFSFSVGIINKLMKFYYKKPVDKYHFFVTLAYNGSVYHEESGQEKYNDLMIKVYEKLMTDQEKNMLILTSYMYSLNFVLDEKINNKMKFKPMNNFFSYFSDLREIEFSRLLRAIFTTLSSESENLFSKVKKSKIINLMSFLSSNKLFFNHVFEIIHRLNNRDKLLKMILPFCGYLKITDKDLIREKNCNGKKCPCCVDHQSINIKLNLNKITYYLKLYSKRFRKNKIIHKKVYFYDVLNEVINYTPNPKKNILRKGSVKYRNNLTKFNEIPPHNLHFGEIDLIDNMLIRMKADGVYSKILPIDIFPSSENLKGYRIKSEYIEELNLYLVFDIDIPDMNIIERYEYLRSIHPSTNFTKLSEVSNYNDLMSSIDREKDLFDNFLKKDYDNYRWYPKASWVTYNISNTFKKELISNVILENDINNLDSIKNFIYNCDGLVLTPLDGSREVKLKPKSLMTIDLLFKNNKWLDGNNNIYNSLVKTSTENFINNRIYRCYPEDEYYVPKEIRFDKNKANPYSVVSTIIKLHRNNWNENYKKNVYYTNNYEFNKTIKKVSKFNNYILKEIIKYINPMVNSDWLDLGCGFGKLLKIIKMYNPNKYLGLDNDVNVVNSCLRRFSKSMKYNYKFCPSDLASDWNDHEQNWYEIKFQKNFDYIVCNFSLMHFCNDKFWTQLNKAAKKNSYMIFNLVNDKSSNRFSDNKSYLYYDKLNDKVKYLFDGTHDSEICEDFISSQMIEKILEKFNWEVVKKFNISKDFLNVTKNLKNDSLELYYDWYVVKLNV